VNPEKKRGTGRALQIEGKTTEEKGVHRKSGRGKLNSGSYKTRKPTRFLKGEPFVCKKRHAVRGDKDHWRSGYGNERAAQGCGLFGKRSAIERMDALKSHSQGNRCVTEESTLDRLEEGKQHKGEDLKMGRMQDMKETGLFRGLGGGGMNTA